MEEILKEYNEILEAYSNPEKMTTEEFMRKFKDLKNLNNIKQMKFDLDYANLEIRVLKELIKC